MRKKLLVAGNLIVGIVASTAVFAVQGARPGHPFPLRDFPPSPLEAKFSTTTEPKSDPLVHDAEQFLIRHAASTNPAALALMAEIKELKDQLLTQQETANAKDPLLQVYGRYFETSHEWVMRNHSREFIAANQYVKPSPTAQSKKPRYFDVIALIDMALYRDLARNTNFAPLLKATFETIERKVPGQLAASYARNDTLIGYQPDLPPRPAPTFEAYLRDLERRYDLVLAKLEQLQKEEEIPPEIIDGWMYGDLYRLLDGNARQYVELNTPDALKNLREQLRRKLIQLSQLETPAP